MKRHEQISSQFWVDIRHAMNAGLEDELEETHWSNLKDMLVGGLTGLIYYGLLDNLWDHIRELK